MGVKNLQWFEKKNTLVKMASTKKKFMHFFRTIDKALSVPPELLMQLQ
jgi:hypothetical protein